MKVYMRDYSEKNNTLNTILSITMNLLRIEFQMNYTMNVLVKMILNENLISTHATMVKSKMLNLEKQKK